MTTTERRNNSQGHKKEKKYEEKMYDKEAIVNTEWAEEFQQGDVRVVSLQIYVITS
jgi:hypothetical protein